MANIWQKLSKPIKILAPMEEVTDTVFRQLIARWGKPDLFFTEFTNAQGLTSSGYEAVSKRLKFTEIERPIIAQIWGTDPKAHFESAKMVKDLGFDGVDINMGCPVKKIIKKGSCSALIENQVLAKEIIQATKEGAAELPLSVKTRIGFNVVKTEEWATFLLQQGLAALTIHGRTTKQLSNGIADWGEIKKVVDIRNNLNLETKIIGNGDVTSVKQIQEKVEMFSN